MEYSYVSPEYGRISSVKVVPMASSHGLLLAYKSGRAAVPAADADQGQPQRLQGLGVPQKLKVASEGSGTMSRWSPAPAASDRLSGASCRAAALQLGHVP